MHSDTRCSPSLHFRRSHEWRSHVNGRQQPHAGDTQRSRGSSTKPASRAAQRSACLHSAPLLTHHSPVCLLSLFPAREDNLETDSHATSQGEEELSVGWARAISLTPSYPNRVLVEPKVDFGRRSTCVVHVKHPAVSGLHCSLQHYGEGLVRLHDHSTNGTFVNSLAVGKGKSQIIHDGDEILLIRGAAEKIGYKIVLLNQRSKPMVRQSGHACMRRTHPRRASLAAHSLACLSTVPLQNEAEQKYKFGDTLGK